MTATAARPSVMPLILRFRMLVTKLVSPRQKQVRPRARSGRVSSVW